MPMNGASLGLFNQEMDSNSSGVSSNALHQALSELSFLDINGGFPNVGESIQYNDFIPSSFLDDESRPVKRSQNMTECVPVPSSEHVAEIVGRQGCKIKALRAKTNTYIKTPVRDEEPVFLVTGRKEDVALAKREILSAAEHFSQIRAQRKNGANAPRPPSIPGQITITVPVAFRVVGLVVGPKGATIKRIQNQTNTYILTPSRESTPVFTVTGLPDNVEQARREIVSHIEMRTNAPYEENFDADCYRRPVARDGKNMSIVLGNPSSPLGDSLFFPQSRRQDEPVFFKNEYSNLAPIGSGIPSPSNIQTSGFGFDDVAWIRPTRVNTESSISRGFQGSIASGLRSLIGSSSTPTPGSSSVTGSLSSGHASPPFGFGTRECSPRSSPPSTASPGACSTDDAFILPPGRKRSSCFVCSEAPVVAALVPCGHNLFCMDCAQSVCDQDLGLCPACHQPVSQAIRIIST